MNCFQSREEDTLRDLRQPKGDRLCPVALTLIVPVFNEADAIGLFIERVDKVFKDTPAVRPGFLFVNDGSSDATLETLLTLRKKRSDISVVDLSRNFGKESALTAGLLAATGDIVVPIDVDLQDPPEIIPEMIDKWRDGYDVVLGRRACRGTDSFLKRLSAVWFYRIHNVISSPKIPENVGDFRLMDKKVVEALQNMPESCRFMKGIFAWMGFRTAFVDYDRPERVAGKTKFNAWRLWNLALEGLTSFSTVPLRIWMYVGFIFSLFSFLLGVYMAFKTLITGVDVPGYASIIVSVTFIGGLQITGIGIIGEYIGRIYMESKRRPIFVVRKVYEHSSPAKDNLG